MGRPSPLGQGLIGGFIGALLLEALHVGMIAGAVPVPKSLQAYLAPQTTIVQKESRDDQITSIVESSDPAVVAIIITKDQPTYEQYFEQMQLPFGAFQIQIPRLRQNGTETVQVGSGSGFFISADGFIVTNLHVVADEAANYTVFTNTGDQYAATVVGVNKDLDVAVLKIEALGLTSLAFGDSSTLKSGQTVIAIGNALGEFRNTVSVGVVSGLSRTITAALGFGRAEVLEDVIQTDAAINAGNSGGPLLNLDGKVIGVNVATSTQGENVSFSLPSNAVEVAVNEIIKPK